MEIFKMFPRYMVIWLIFEQLAIINIGIKFTKIFGKILASKSKTSFKLKLRNNS